MKFQKFLFLMNGLIILGGCEGPPREFHHSSQAQHSYMSPDEPYPFYNPIGDLAYSYDPVYSPVSRDPTYYPGTPVYDYSYYDSYER
jgi:hypothetical protein